MTDHSAAQEMFLMGDADGSVWIQCRRKGCEVRRLDTSPLAASPYQTSWLEIPVDFWATPKDVDRIWMQHRLEHANREQ